VEQLIPSRYQDAKELISDSQCATNPLLNQRVDMSWLPQHGCNCLL